MIDVTVLFLDETVASTAVGPMEVFRHAGSTVEYAHRHVARSPVSCHHGFGGWPRRSLRRPHSNSSRTSRSKYSQPRSDFIPTTGLGIDDVVERNAHDCALVEAHAKARAAIASVCSGVGLVAATGLLDGKRATTHWGLAERFAEKYPRVKWMPELMVTEDHGFYCGGGVNASLDLSLYLVEKFCGHEIAMETAKALLIEMPRAWQSGFAIVPLKTDHTDDNISSAQEWLHKNFRRLSRSRIPPGAWA